MTESFRTTTAAGLWGPLPDDPSLSREELRARVAAARTLGFLVHEILEALATRRDAESNDPDADGGRDLKSGHLEADAVGGGGRERPEADKVRDVLRQFTARVRATAISLRLERGAVAIEGVELDPREVLGDRWLGFLSRTMQSAGIEGISIREAAAPAELVTLARLLARMSLPSVDGSVRVAPGSRELLRSWSVVVIAMASGEGGGSLPRTPGALAGTLTTLMQSINRTGPDAGRLELENRLYRLLSPATLMLLAEELPASTDSGLLLQIFARAGEMGVKVLLDKLIASAEAASRRAYFDAIVALDQGGDLLRGALSDSRWYVVRNAAAMISEIRLEGADSDLAALLYSTDSRVRIAAARALLRLRTQHSMNALHGALGDRHAEVRRLAATSYSVAAATPALARPPATALAEALDRETDEDVALAIMAAMGKLGSADAVQKLLRIAQSPTEGTTEAEGALERGYIPRPSWVRIAALEALVEARGSAVAPAIQAISLGDDEMVTAAALSLLATL